MTDLSPETLWPHEMALNWIYVFWITVVIVFLLFIIANMMMIYFGWISVEWVT